MNTPCPVYDRDGMTLYHGEALAIMPTLPAGSIDAVICDPPYPEIDREYGRWTEAEWHDLMRGVVAECRRVLTPKGSAVFILQPNSERVGRMRLWLWEFVVWAGKEWGLVQDAYWWNTSTMPVGGANVAGLMRSSLKYAVWLGEPDVFRSQSDVLLEESAGNRQDRLARDFEREDCSSRVRSETEGPRDNYRRLRTAVERRGGATPFNVLAIGSDGRWNGGTDGHPASTPLRVADWWLRYICPPGGLCLDPFAGSCAVGVAAARLRRRFIGIERHAPYIPMAIGRLSGPPLPLFDIPAGPMDQAETPLFHSEGPMP